MESSWSKEKANNWYARQPWLVGCNFIPSTAINQLEMWQEETFDPETINRELQWAAGLGMNTVRVFLHDLAWTIDPDGFKRRMRRFLDIAGGHGIRTLFVIFDDCWYPDPQPGRQPDPEPGLHNSGWIQSPGIRAAIDRSQWKRLERYVRDIVGSFRNDERILMWDIYNELGNIFLDTLSLPAVRRIPKMTMLIAKFLFLPIRTFPLFRETLRWVRDSGPSQPVTAGVWTPAGKHNRELIAASDIVTFHDYTNARSLEKNIQKMKSYGRPVLCTEFMARTRASLFETCLPVMKKEKVGCYSWGLVSGKTQTIYTWADRGVATEPPVWYHDILRRDGTPFNHEETSLIRTMTGLNINNKDGAVL